MLGWNYSGTDKAMQAMSELARAGGRLGQAARDAEDAFAGASWPEEWPLGPGWRRLFCAAYRMRLVHGWLRVMDARRRRTTVECRRMQFLEDPMTVAYGVGSEMVGLINCDCLACQAAGLDE